MVGSDGTEDPRPPESPEPEGAAGFPNRKGKVVLYSKHPFLGGEVMLVSGRVASFKPFLFL